jgi:hypothetical protein
VLTFLLTYRAKLSVLSWDNGHQPQITPISVIYAAVVPRFASFRLADTGLNNVVIDLLLTALDNGPTPVLTADVRTSLLATVGVRMTKVCYTRSCWVFVLVACHSESSSRCALLDDHQCTQ